MPLVAFEELMDDARRGAYAVGYFESWSVESLLAVADAAEACRSPVILGFSGIYLPHPNRVTHDPLAVYAAMGLEVCRGLKTPACLLFNESPHLPWVFDAIDTGFSLVMFSRDDLSLEELVARVRQVCERAHGVGCEVEAEMTALPGVGGQNIDEPRDLKLTNPAAASAFVHDTGIGCLAVNIGQLHLHGRRMVGLDLDLLARLRQAVDVPLALHGASSVRREELVAAVRLGICKVNVGSLLKQSFYSAMRTACECEITDCNPYEVIGSGLAADVLTAGRSSMRRTVEEFMTLFGSAGRA